MNLSRGFLKYGLYFLIGAWMFVLGVMVGRGTSPVTFDTSSFQERLKIIVGNIPEPAPATEKVDLDFYEALNKPVVQDTVLSPPSADKSKQKPPAENKPPEQAGSGPEEEKIPVKFSRKQATFKKTAAVAETSGGSHAEEVVPTGPVTKKPVEKKAAAARPSGKTSSTSENGGQYTIQVAAYRAFKDAVSQMSQLEKKGFSSYRIKAEANGTIWYRVRTGSFRDFPSAQAELNRLKQARINGMIIKKENQ